MRFNLLKAGAATLAHASLLAAALGMAACSPPPAPVLNVNGSTNIAGTAQEDFDWALQNTTALGADAKSLDLALANDICDAYPTAEAVWVAAAANPALSPSIVTAGNNFQASVASGCKGAPFTTVVAQVEAIDAAWTSWIDLADQNKVNLTPNS